ncbi:LptA/OstA family protein [Phenylobacterium sp.]|uniref:LptA/OstA family protein n=1 Tax=Phenylobacterium sp. TaxID=1871053 RepID=UPI0012191B5F|nr:LptA/OstA family protein [Phenylobacterium sp.]THD59884.1 MAG: hypothetical protein E8A49_15110 [Phenylobacterium sp.]
MKSLIAIAATAAASLLAGGSLAAAPAKPAAAAPAPAQTPPAADAPANGKPRPKKSPIDITADQLETHNADCVSIWTGSAEALQDTSRLRSDIMIAHLEVKKGQKPATTTSGGSTDSDCGEMTTLEAKGNVYYATADGKRVHGDNGFYDAATTTLTVTGDVTSVEGQNVMRGTKMVYNTQTGEGHVEGQAVGPGAKNRPRGVFYPKDADATAAENGTPAPAPTKTKKKVAK